LEAFDFVEMKVPAKAEYVGVIRLSISGIASRMGFSYEAIEDLKIALSEAATNVVSHAYDLKEDGELSIGFGIYEDRLEIMVSDQGESFRFEEIKNRIGPVDVAKEVRAISELREGGFGLFLINALMDKVEINNQYGVIVLMTKYLDEAEVGLNDSISSEI
jgi:serine/threonine-protein kinase RsbW